MKKILAMAAAAVLVTGVSAFAANPFADVTPDDWAYQAISDLSDQGVVEGYPDGTFKGERNITRYEAAQIIARLLAKEDQLNAEQRAALDKLAGEYSDELANLGVRVSNLEKKVGNIYWSGDARMRYIHATVGDTDIWDGRIRINAKGQVNDRTYVNGQFTSNMNFKTGTDATTAASQLYVNHNFGDDFSIRAGRQPIIIGNQGGWFYGNYQGYDGIQADYRHGALALTAGYGQFNAANGDFYKDDNDSNKPDFFIARGSYDFGAFKLGADYISFKDKHNVVEGRNEALRNTKPEIYGVNLNVPVGDFFAAGEYWKNTTAATGDDTAWNAGIGYGKFNWNKPGSFSLAVYYNDVDQGAYVGGTAINGDLLESLNPKYGATDPNNKYYRDPATNITFWNIIADVALQKNVDLHAEYEFAADASGTKAGDPGDSWSVSLNYKF